MKFRYVLPILMLVATMGPAFGQTAPPEGWPNCGGCLFRAVWTGLGAPSDDSCNYANCGGDCAALVNPDSTFIHLVGNLMTVSIGNAFVPENSKSLFIRLEGTGGSAGSPPVIQGLVAYNSNGYLSKVYMGTPEISVDGGGNWIIIVRAKIFPQPDKMTLIVGIPGTPALTHGWVYECCTVSSIPSITSYGIAVLVGLMILSAVWIILRRRKKAIAGV